MIEFFHVKRDIPFMSYGKLTTAISLLTFVLAVFFLVAKGLNFGIEFTGGTVMELRYQKPADLNQIRTRVDSLKLGETQVQSMGTTVDVMLRLPNIKDKNSAQLSNAVLDALKQSGKKSSHGILRAGEQFKHIKYFPDMIAAVDEPELDRKTLIVALGGGVVGDVGVAGASGGGGGAVWRGVMNNEPQIAR